MILPSSMSCCNGAALESEQQRPAARIISSNLFQRIDSETAQELGIEVSGFLRQDITGEGDVAHLLDPGGVHEKGDVCALTNPGDRLEGVALILHMLLVADGFFRDSQNTLEHDAMQLHHVELALQRRDSI